MIADSKEVIVNVLEDSIGDVAVGCSSVRETGTIMKVTYDN